MNHDGKENVRDSRYTTSCVRRAHDADVARDTGSTHRAHKVLRESIFCPPARERAEPLWLLCCVRLFRLWIILMWVFRHA